MRSASAEPDVTSRNDIMVSLGRDTRPVRLLEPVCLVRETAVSALQGRVRVARRGLARLGEGGLHGEAGEGAEDAGEDRGATAAAEQGGREAGGAEELAGGPERAGRAGAERSDDARCERSLEPVRGDELERLAGHGEEADRAARARRQVEEL